MAFRHQLSNEYPQGYAFDERYIPIASSTITADGAVIIAFVAPKNFNGTLHNVDLIIGTNGEDGTDPMQMTTAVAKNGTSVFTTAPVITKAAGAGARNSFVTATGVTPAVLKTDGTCTIVPADIITVQLDITRTTPEVEYANVAVVLTIRPTAATTIQT